MTLNPDERHIAMKYRSAGQGGRIRVPFRIALSTILAILLLGTVAVIGFLSYSRRVMESQPYFTFLSVGLETGEMGMLSIERLQDGSLVFREVRRDRNNDTVEIVDYRPEDFRERKAYSRIIVPRRTDRRPSWCLQARDTGRPV